MKSRLWIMAALATSMGACRSPGFDASARPGGQQTTLQAAALESAATTASRVEGLHAVRSSNDFATTVQRARAAIESRGLGIMAEVDHAANARRVDMQLPPTTLLLFGNPEVGTQLMQARRTIAIDLPLSLLVWEDDDGNVCVAYDDPAWLAERHALRGREGVVTKMRTVLHEIAAEATSSG